MTQDPLPGSAATDVADAEALSPGIRYDNRSARRRSAGSACPARHAGRAARQAKCGKRTSGPASLNTRCSPGRYVRTVSTGPEVDSARIPVFSSVPSKLDERQAVSRRYIYSRLRALGLEPRTVGGSDRGMYNPLHEVRTLARHCAGGIILGYSQVTAKVATGLAARQEPDGTVTISSKPIRPYSAATPWNQLETGILFGLGLPLFVLKEERITGGIFDEGASDVLVHAMPMPSAGWTASCPDELHNPHAEQGFEAALLRWQGLVRSHYYRPDS